jgi:hypothetical protein
MNEGGCMSKKRPFCGSKKIYLTAKAGFITLGSLGPIPPPLGITGGYAFMGRISREEERALEEECAREERRAKEFQCRCEKCGYIWEQNIG